MIEKVKLKEICRLINGRAYKQNELLASGKYPVLRVGNLFSDKDYYYSDLELEDDKYCDNGDLLFAWSASFGPKIWNGGKVIYHYHIWKMDLSDRVNRDYLFYYLYYLSKRIKSEGHGGIMIHTTKAEMEEREFILPNLSHQKKISKLFAMISNVIAMRKQEIQKLDELIKARFVEMFGTFPLNEKGWEIGTIRDLVIDVRYGSSRKAADGNNGQYPYLRMNNITYGGDLDLTDTKTIDVPAEELPKCSVRRGDLLFNRTNSKELVGKTCVYNRDELMVLAGFVIRVRLNDKAIPEFVSAFLNTDFSKQMLLGMCKAAIGQANINAQEFQNIKIYVPPIDEQRRFVEFKEQTDKSKVA